MTGNSSEVIIQAEIFHDRDHPDPKGRKCLPKSHTILTSLRLPSSNLSGTSGMVSPVYPESADGIAPGGPNIICLRDWRGVGQGGNAGLKWWGRLGRFKAWHMCKEECCKKYPAEI
jgi:hypothetical protein